MRSILEKALVALINEDKASADKLFHDFVLERSRQIHESIRQGEDFVLDEGLEDSIAVEDMFGSAPVLEQEDDGELDDFLMSAANDTEELKRHLDLAAFTSRADLAAHLHDLFMDLAGDEGFDIPAGKLDGYVNDAIDNLIEDFGLVLGEGKSYKRNRDDDADEKKKQDKDQSKARQQKRQPVEESAKEVLPGDYPAPGWYLVNGRNEPVYGPFDSEADAEQHGDTDGRFRTCNAEFFSDFSLKQLMREGKSFKHDDEDGDAKDKKKQDKKKRDEQKSKRERTDESNEAGWWVVDMDGDLVTGDFPSEQAAQFAADELSDNDPNGYEYYVEYGVPGADHRKVVAVKRLGEGQLTATQGDDGTLTIVHEPTGSELAAPAVAPVVDPMGGEIASPETDMDMDLDAGVDNYDDLSDDEFSSLGESLVSELEKIIVTNKDGEEAGNGKAVKQERHSPTPNRSTTDRVDQAAPVEIKGAEHNGFDKETAPAVEGSKVRQNAFTKGEDSLDTVKDGGDTKALLNQLGDDKSAKSPIAGK